MKSGKTDEGIVIALKRRIQDLEAKNKALSEIASQMLLEATSHANKMDNLRERLSREVMK